MNRSTSAQEWIDAAKGAEVDPNRVVADQYRTDANLALRQSLFDFAVDPPTPQPQLRDLFEWPAHATVVDVGCGNGLWAGTIAEVTPAARLVTVDLSAGMVSACAAKVPTALGAVGDMARLPLRDSTADAVLALWVLYHVPDKTRAFREVNRVLRPGGRFIAATNAASMGELGELFHVAAEEAMGGAVKNWMPSLDFTIENGNDLLATHFDDVVLHVHEAWFEVPVAEPLVGYAASLRGAIQLVLPGMDFDSFLVAVADGAHRLFEHGPCRFSRRTGFFAATASAA